MAVFCQAMHVVLGMTSQASGKGVRFRFVNTAFSTVYCYSGNHKWVVWALNDFTHLAVQNFDLDKQLKYYTTNPKSTLIHP
ncbi:MAG: hypothetical protein ACOCYU_06735 [Brevefilum sp.]